MRNLPLAVAVVRRHLGDHRLIAAARLLRVLPGCRLPRLGMDLPVLRALSLGVRADPAFPDAIRRLAASNRLRRRRAAVAAAVACHRPDLAREALGSLPDRRELLSALVLRAEGNLTAAGAELQGVPGRAARRLHRSVSGEIAAMSPHGHSFGAGRRRTGPVRAVLHLVTNSLPEVNAGYTTRTHGIVTAQRRSGLDAAVATRIGFPVTAGRLAAGPLRTHAEVPYHRILPWWLPRYADQVLAADVAATQHLVTRLRPQVLHAHSKYVNAAVALAVRDRTGIPVVYEVRGLLEETWASRLGSVTADAYLLARASETEAMLAADAVVVISEGLRRAVLDRGVPQDRVIVVPNAVGTEFLEAPPDATELRGQLGFADHEVVVGTVTTLNHYEGLDVLLQAVALLRGRGLPVRALIVGDGPARQPLVELAARVLGEAATFTGRVPFAAVRGYHAALDVFCVPRLDLSVTSQVPPLKPLEALATARPVVASDLPPLREIVAAGWGALAPPGDPEHLAATLEPYVADPTLRAQHGMTGRDWVSEHRTWAVAAARYAELYQVISSR